MKPPAQRKPLRRRRKGVDALLTQKLDTAWSALVKARAGNRCERCERSDKRLDAHHYVGRGNFRTRWLLANGVCLCSWECHRTWAHNYPAEFVDWMRAIRPDDARRIDYVAREVAHWTVAEKREILLDLEASLANEMDEAA